MHNFEQFTLNFSKNFKNEGLDNLQNLLQKMENDYHENKVETRDWHVKGYKTRRLWTPFGDILFTRRIYQTNPNNFKQTKQKILFDEFFGLKPNFYIQPCFFKLFINKLNEVGSYRALSDIYNQTFSSRQISTFLQKQDINVIPKQICEKADLVFVNLDDIYVNLHKSKKMCIRSAVAYTGVETKYKRKTLINRCILPINASLNINEQAQELEQLLIKIYGKIKRVIIVGDGASWITNFKNHFAYLTAERYIDQFHFKKYVRDCLGRKIKIDWEHLLTLKKEKALRYLLHLITDDDGVVHFAQQKLWTKIVRWFSSYSQAWTNQYPCCVEGIQSHYIAKTHKNRRSFSRNNAFKILTLNIANYNNWEISYEKKVGAPLHLMSKSGAIMDLLVHRTEFSNVPILESSCSETVKALNILIHGFRN